MITGDLKGCGFSARFVEIYEFSVLAMCIFVFQVMIKKLLSEISIERGEPEGQSAVSSKVAKTHTTAEVPGQTAHSRSYMGVHF